MGEGYAVMGVVGMIDSACCIQSSDTSDRAFAAPDTFLAKKKGFFGCGLACFPPARFNLKFGLGDRSIQHCPPRPEYSLNGAIKGRENFREYTVSWGE